MSVWYKLTLKKDISKDKDKLLASLMNIPDIKAGYTVSVEEGTKAHTCCGCAEVDPRDVLIKLQDDPEYVEKIPDPDETVTGIVCSKCGFPTMFFDVSDESSKYFNGGVTKYYKEVKLVCSNCHSESSAYSVGTGTHVSW